MKRVKFILFFAFFATVFDARAGLMLDADVSSFSDSTVGATTTAEQKSFYGIGLYVPVDSKDRFYLGASLLSASSVDSGTAGTTFSTQDYVLGFRWFLTKSRMFIVSGGYGIQALASYQATSGSTAETWRGTSSMIKLTAAPEIKNFNVGLSLIYYQGSFTERTVSNTVTTVTYSKSFLFPCLGVSYNW